MFADVDLIYFSKFIFKENHVLVEEDNPSEKNVIVKEELDDIDVDDVVEILKYSLMLKSFLEILTKRRSQTFYKRIDVHSVTNILGENISSISMWRNIVNQWSKYDFSLCVCSK